MRRGLVFITLASCLGTMQPARIDAARFAARPEWTPAAYALPAGARPPADPRAAISRDDAIEDVAFLDHALAQAWPDADDALGELFRDRARDAPITARTALSLCQALANEVNDPSLQFAIAGRSCAPRPAKDTPPEPLVEIPAGKNYVYRLDHAAGIDGAPDTDIPVLAIARFVDPADPGWDGFADALRDLATHDVVVIDLQRAAGDDPRMGFALLAALGRTDVANLGWDAPRASDSAYAQVARANLAARTPQPAPRSHALWSSFGARPDVAALGRAVVPVARDRDHRLAQADVIIGHGCGPACGAVAAVAELASGEPPLPRVDVFGGQTPDPRGDEHGLIRLPKSGIEVTFPTAVYGPSLGVSSLGGAPDAGFAAAALRQMHWLAGERARSRAWSAQPLPACKTLPSDREVLRRKLGGCPPFDLGAGTSAPASASLMASVSLDAAHAKAFLDGCPGVRAAGLFEDDLHGITIVELDGSLDAIARVAAAPFVRNLEWSCPVHLD